MSREEAIEVIQKFIGWFKSDSRIYKALKMAIQALLREPCTDAVSRKNAVRCVLSSMFLAEASEKIEKLPSVNPQPCDDAISREDAYEIVMMPDTPFGKHKGTLIRELPSVTQKSCEKCNYKIFTELYFHTDPEMKEENE